PVLVPEGIQIFTLGKRPAPVTRLRLKRPPFLPSQGESMIQVIQDPEGRPVKFRCLSGDKTLFDYDAFIIVQWSYRGAPDQPVGSYGAWSYKAEVMTQTRIETKVVTTNGPF
ncbi:MAG: hypothetical protein LWX11_03825, partial [Firmicutes bacterium]|nr:hypothetical protein [Bacillota bacterium]